MSNGIVPQSPASDTALQGKGGTFAAAFQYTEAAQSTQDVSAPERSSADQIPDGAKYDSLSYQRHRSQRSLGINGYTATPDPPPALYVRALYNYDADDHTSLSFRQGDIIQVLTQLESGWWDGVIHDIRGWFPSNYCAVVSGPDDPRQYPNENDDSDGSADSATDDDLDDEQDEDVDSEGNLRDPDAGLPIEGHQSTDQNDAAVWVLQATPDGRLFYFNTLTGVSTMRPPLETPSSTNEGGPSDRTNFAIPDQTRAPLNMISRGDGLDEDDREASMSEAEGEQLISATNGVLPYPRRSVRLGRLSSTTSLDSKNASPVAEMRKAPKNAYRLGSTIVERQPENSLDQNGAGPTSFSEAPPGPSRDLAAPSYFWDDGSKIPITWDALVEYMCRTVDTYRAAIQNQQRAEFVRKAEDISDLLRFLLAAGSGTTDNHSGNPSIISTNRGLYPHFRDMMSRFSKLVLSSHLAAVDWPSPDAYSKCLQEADGVLHGVYGYVEVARRQRGEEIARLLPGFVLGSSTGGNWQNNNVDAPDPLDESSFQTQDEGNRHPAPAAMLDFNLLGRIDEARKCLNTNIRRLEDQLYLSDNVITSAAQTQLGDTVCLAAGKVIESFKPYICLVESANLGSLGSGIQRSRLLNFGIQKQQAYNNVAELLVTCQSITAPLSDEWAEIRGQPLQERLSYAVAVCRQFDKNVSQIVYSMRLLVDAVTPEDTFQPVQVADVDADQNFPVLDDVSADEGTRPTPMDRSARSSFDSVEGFAHRLRRLDPTDKARRFFGQVPPLDVTSVHATQDFSSAVENVPWYLQLDHPNEVFYDMRTVPPQLKHGTLIGLVEQLTRHDRQDGVFLRTFLLTYRSFTSAVELFELLVKRFSMQPPPGIAQAEIGSWESNKQSHVRIRVVKVLKSWLEHYWMEDNDELGRALLERMYSFVRDSIATTKTGGAAPLMTAVEQRLKGQDTSAKRLVVTLSNSAPAPILPKNMKKLKFLDIDVTEFARQLTIIESKLYGKIRSPECLGKTWQRKGGANEADPAPNVKALILHSNQLTNWVAEMILSQSEMKKRVVVIKHFVSIADQCRLMNNYSTLTSIISALGTAAIHRLGRTWNQVSPKTINTLNAMRQLMASTRSFWAYRERLRQSNPPCIPFLGVYLTDLTFIEDGMPSIVKSSNLINFAKRSKTAEVIYDIEQYQNTPYSLTPVLDLQEYILNNMREAGDVHEKYDRSLHIEPREREDEKIARLLSESGFL